MQAPPAAALLVAPDAGDAATVEVAAGQAFPVLDGPAAGRAAEELAAGLAAALAAAPGDAGGTSATVSTEGSCFTLALHTFVAIASTDVLSASAGGSLEVPAPGPRVSVQGTELCSSSTPVQFTLPADQACSCMQSCMGEPARY